MATTANGVEPEGSDDVGEELEVTTPKKASGHAHSALMQPQPRRGGDVSVKVVAQVIAALVGLVLPTSGAYGAWASNRDLAASNRELVAKNNELVLKVDEVLKAQHAMELHMAKLDAADAGEQIKALEERVRRNAEELAELRATVHSIEKR